MVKPEIMLCEMVLNLSTLRYRTISGILTAWDTMDQRVIDKAVRQWCTRLRACIKAKGRHFKVLNTHCVSNVFLLTEQY